MKKLIVLVVIVLAASWVGATYFIGGKVEDEYRGLVQKYANLGPIKISVKSYQGGFLSATAETLMEMTVPKTPAEPGQAPEFETVQLVFGHDIFYGPLPIGAPQGAAPALALISTRIVSASGQELDLDDLLQQVPELRNAFSYSRVGFDGSISGQMEVPPLSRQIDEATFNWGGLTATSVYKPGGKLVGQVDMPNMNLSFADGSMTWQGIHYELDMDEVLPMLFVGSGNMVLGGMEMDFPDKKSGKRTQVRMQEVRIDADSSFDGQLVHYRQTIAGQGMTVDDQTYGPLEVDLEMNNFNAQALSDYQQSILNLYGNFDQLNPDAMIAEMLPVYSDLAIRLLADSPEFNIRRFYVNTPMGEAAGTINIKYDHPQQEAPAELSMLPMYLPFFFADANLNIDQDLVKAVLKSQIETQFAQAAAAGQQPQMSELEKQALINQQVEMMLQMYAAQGFLVQDGNKIKSRLVFADGQLQVNGKQLPIFGAQ